MDGRSICFVERSLEYKGNSQLRGYFLVGGGNLQSELSGFQNIHASEQGEGQIVGDLEVANCNASLRIHQ